jgi:hypothetical protein
VGAGEGLAVESVGLFGGGRAQFVGSLLAQEVAVINALATI